LNGRKKGRARVEQHDGVNVHFPEYRRCVLDILYSESYVSIHQIPKAYWQGHRFHKPYALTIALALARESMALSS
jgi:hypothetical protein